MPKTETIIVKDKTFEVIKSAVNKMVDLIRPTFGPASNKVIIDKGIYRMVIDDGVQIARDFELEDPSENAIVKLVRETAIKTNDRVGDGTTSSLIILQSIINEVARKSKVDGRKVELELKKGLEEVKKQLLKSTKQIKTKEELKKVALVAFDNEKIADILADTYFKLGKDGIITIDKSSTMETFIEINEGIKLDKGFISPYMITNPQRIESVVEKPYILLTDYKLVEANDILSILNKMVAANKFELVVICENMEQHALATAIVNSPYVVNSATGRPGRIFTVAVQIPYNSDKKQMMEDLALLTGAKLFTESKGDKLENVEIADLGRAEQFICRRDESIIIQPKGKKSGITSAIISIQTAIALETNESKKKELQNRLGLFTNKLARIKVGAPTENEQKALKYKVEDAVNSVKVAFKNGVVCGAGLALSKIKTSSPILNEALQYPARQLRENMGMDETILKDDEAINVVTKKVGKFLDVGVIDPVDVLIAGVESAVSIASILVTSSGMIIDEVIDPKD